MNPLKYNWGPENIEWTFYSCVNTAPLGKPDPSLPRPATGLRPRVFQKAQVGPTCMYYAARRLSPQYGKAEGLSFARFNEKVLSIFRRFVSMTSQIQESSFTDEQKSFAIASFIAYLGLNLHFPVQALYVAMMSTLYSSVATSLGVQVPSQPQVIPQSFYNSMNSMFRCFASNSLRLMLYRMRLKPLYWNPMWGPKALVDALKTNLYVFCMGDFGTHVFTSLHQVDYQPKLGPILSGPLRPIAQNTSAFFGMHAVVIIGARERAFMQGEVYFIDPHDPSGPQVMQKVYVITLKDFFYRIKDSHGNSPLKSTHHEFAWIGEPRVFLP